MDELVIKSILGRAGSWALAVFSVKKVVFNAKPTSAQL